MNSEEIDFSRSEIEIFWEGILSREKATILSTFLSVTLAEQESCLKHLNRMAHEEGWHEEQRKSAQIALDVLNR